MELMYMSNFLNRDKRVYKFNKDEMILRDFLAVDRTLLANERTLLAYIRPASKSQ